MKVLILSDANSSHTKKWVYHLVQEGIRVSVFSLSKPKDNYYDALSVKIFYSSIKHYTKVFYIWNVPQLKTIIQREKPDIIHSHYASSYGLLGALSQFHPLVISVWGSDVYEFPFKSFVNKKIIEFNLSCADAITSTSETMAIHTQQFTSKTIQVIPFGVDLNKFYKNRVRHIFSENDIVIGCVKTLSHKYGIDTLIQSFAILKNNLSNYPLKLLIVGDGPDKNFLMKLTEKLGISHSVVFTGYVENEFVPQMWNEMDIAVILSREESESFGVAAVEAMACELPVVVSCIGGLKEVVTHKSTGWVVMPNNPVAASEAVEFLLTNPSIRDNIATHARKEVERKYNIFQNVKAMINVYYSVLEKKKY